MTSREPVERLTFPHGSVECCGEVIMRNAVEAARALEGQIFRATLPGVGLIFERDRVLFFELGVVGVPATASSDAREAARLIGILRRCTLNGFDARQVDGSVRVTYLEGTTDTVPNASVDDFWRLCDRVRVPGSALVGEAERRFRTSPRQDAATEALGEEWRASPGD